MGTPLGPKYIPYTYMDPLGELLSKSRCLQCWHGMSAINPVDEHAVYIPLFIPKCSDLSLFVYIPICICVYIYAPKCKFLNSKPYIMDTYIPLPLYNPSYAFIR